MFLLKKIDATVLDVCIAYGCAAFLMYVVGGIAYGIGKYNGTKMVQIVINEDQKTSTEKES